VSEARKRPRHFLSRASKKKNVPNNNVEGMNEKIKDSMRTKDNAKRRLH
jgi:hypothetical protein